MCICEGLCRVMHLHFEVCVPACPLGPLQVLLNVYIYMCVYILVSGRPRACSHHLLPIKHCVLKRRNAYDILAQPIEKHLESSRSISRAHERSALSWRAAKTSSPCGDQMIFLDKDKLSVACSKDRSLISVASIVRFGRSAFR